MLIYTEPKDSQEIPIIDLAGTFDENEAAIERAAAAIRDACMNTGFFYVTNHGVDQRLIDQAFAQSNRFFDQPHDWKMKLAKKSGTNGYEPSETQRLDNGSPGDIKESYNFSMTTTPGTPDYVLNQWPENFDGFQKELDAYHEKLRALGLHISRLIAKSLGMPFHYFDPTFENQKAALRLLRYPPQPADAKFNQLGAGAHTDWGWITVLAQDDIGGLEVQTVAGDWIRVKPVPGAFVVNLGDLVEHWTNGIYHSSLHRVMNNRSGRNRHSIVLFYDQSYETPVEVLPTCIKPGEKPKYEPCISGEHRRAKYLASRAASAPAQ